MESAQSTPTMLVIDDSPETHRLLDVRLRAEGINIQASASGADGLADVLRLRPALVLLDLDMPGMDGFEVLRSLKDDATTVNVPVIVISGSEATEDKVTGLELGAIDYVCKPFNFAELRARIRSALRVHELMQLLEQKAQIDGLTGLWNRRYFDDRLADELAVRSRKPAPLSLVMCDLDAFKSLNDTFGHHAGDQALKGFGELLVRSMRRHDIACRYGGEEFGVILRETTGEQARALMERIRIALETTTWPRHPERRVTASFGVCADVCDDAHNSAAWIEAADRALYSAKRGGRNRVCLAPPSGPTSGGASGGASGGDASGGASGGDGQPPVARAA